MKQLLRLVDKLRGAWVGWRLGYQALSSDALTGLTSRSFFERLGRRRIERRARSSTIAVVTFDINRFKPVNDLLGHAMGDRILGILGHCVIACLRRSSDAYRFGGDEVVAFLDGASKELAEQYGEKVRGMFLTLSSNLCSSLPEGFGLSFGVELMTREGALQVALERSDARMYDDKAQRRVS